ncbi:MAG: hypothetical protein FWD33_01470 [Alphaproteobacteria bacterium]|nr:hypothetical protein [Alphaproteobacteria bacterium]
MSETKTLYFAPSPFADNFPIVREIWNGMEKMNISNLKMVGIQAHSKTEYSIINSPDDFKPVQGILDVHIAPMLALCLINDNWLAECEDDKGAYKEWKFEPWKNHESGVYYPLKDATEFGLAFGGCGRMGAMMIYSWTRFMSAYEPSHTIQVTRQNFNINGLTAAIAPSFDPDIKQIIQSARTMLTTDFTGDAFGLDANKADIGLTMGGLNRNHSLKYFGIDRLRQI